VSSADAASRLRHAEERAEGLKAVAAERGSVCSDLVFAVRVFAWRADTAVSETTTGQRVVQLEVRCAELESANEQLLLDSKSAAHHLAELKKAREKLHSLSQASDLAGQPCVPPDSSASVPACRCADSSDAHDVGTGLGRRWLAPAKGVWTCGAVS